MSIIPTVKLMLAAAQTLKEENQEKLREMECRFSDEYWQVVKAAQDLCPHTDTVDNGFENGHNGNWEDRIECSLCRKRM